MSDLETAALRTTAQIAFRFIDTLSEREREQVLTALVVTCPQEEGEIAQRALYHLQQQRKEQMTLKAILEGVK
ncbi:MAG: hypothetical protein C0518_05475 [Opitutus sp.]|nr:hypothetical protein [Opitutus sp.]